MSIPEGSAAVRPPCVVAPGPPAVQSPLVERVDPRLHRGRPGDPVSPPPGADCLGTEGSHCTSTAPLDWLLLTTIGASVWPAMPSPPFGLGICCAWLASDRTIRRWRDHIPKAESRVLLAHARPTAPAWFTRFPRHPDLCGPDRWAGGILSVPTSADAGNADALAGPAAVEGGGDR